MGVKRVMYWRQPASSRTMQNVLELSAAAQSRLNVLDERASRWSAEVTLRKRADEPDAPGMFVSLTAKDVAPEVFSCAFESPETHPNTHPNPRSPTRSVLVLRGERRCVEGDVPVKEYLSRCKTYKLAHKSKVDGVRFWAGDFAVGVARVENMQGTYVGAVVEIEYAPLSDARAAAAALDEYAAHVADAVRSAEGGEGGELVPVPPDLLGSYGLEDEPFGDAHTAVMYVHALAAM